MIQIAIVEDREADRAHLRECLEFLALQENVQFNIFEFASGLEIIGNYQSIYDIILLDIDIPGMNGMEAARAIRREDASVILVFVTSMAQYAVQGYDVDALSFMVKPVSKYDFAMKMSRAVARTTKRRDDTVQIRTDRENYLIRCSNITYVDVSGHYVVYHTTERDFMEYNTLKAAEGKIAKDYFVKCNRYYLVNLRYVTDIRNDTVYLRNTQIQLSRGQKKIFCRALNEYMGGGRG